MSHICNRHRSIRRVFHIVPLLSSLLARPSMDQRPHSAIDLDSQADRRAHSQHTALFVWDGLPPSLPPRPMRWSFLLWRNEMAGNRALHWEVRYQVQSPVSLKEVARIQPPASNLLQVLHMIFIVVKNRLIDNRNSHRNNIKFESHFTHSRFVCWMKPHSPDQGDFVMMDLFIRHKPTTVYIIDLLPFRGPNDFRDWSNKLAVSD